MGFQTYHRPNNRTGRHSQPALGIDRHGFITITAAAHQLLGNPTAVTIAWDPDEYLILLTATDPDTPGTYRIGGKAAAKKFNAAGFLEHAGLGIPDTARRVPARRHGTHSIVADFSTMPAANTTRKAAA